MRAPFIGGAYAGRSTDINAQQLINFYVEADAKDTRTPKYAVPRAGLTLALSSATLGGGVGRGLYAFNDSTLFAIVGSILWQITTSPSYSAVYRGTLATSTGRCTMVDNGASEGHQIMIVDSSGNGYVYDTNAHTLIQLNNVTNGWPTGMTGQVSLTWQDGYGIFNFPGSGKFYWTNGYDFTTIQGLNFAEAEACPDNLTSLISDGTKIYLLGPRTVEVWYDAGLPNQAFVRVPAAVFPIGIAGVFARTLIDNSLLFLGVTNEGQAAVYQMRGASVPVAISEAGLNYNFTQWLAAETSAGTSPIMFTIHYEGHLFAVITFPTSNITFVWDAVTREWAQWATYSGGNPQVWSPQFHAYFSQDIGAANHYFLDAAGNLLYWDETNKTDNTATITRVITGPHLYQENKRIQISELELMLANTTQGDTVTLQYSKNYGHTFNTGIPITLGADSSSTPLRYRLTGLGYSRDWVFTLTTTSNPIVMDMFITTAAEANQNKQ